MKYLLAAVLLASCATSPQARIESDIRAQYDKLEQAFGARDMNAILVLRHPDFEAFGPDGQHDNAERMAESTRLWLENNKPPIVVRFTLQAFDIRSADEVAVQTIQRASRYQETEGTRRHVEHEVRQRETWVRTPAGWKIRKVDQIDLKNRKRWIDGELQQPRQ